MFGSGYCSYAPALNGTLMPQDTVEPGRTRSAEEIANEVATMDKFHEEQRVQHPELFVEDLPGCGAKDGGERHYEAEIELATLNINNAQVDVGGLLGSQDVGSGFVQTGIEDGPVNVKIRTLDEAPGLIETGWEDISEVSFRAGNDARTSIRGDEGYSTTDHANWVQRLDAPGEG